MRLTHETPLPNDLARPVSPEKSRLRQFLTVLRRSLKDVVAQTPLLATVWSVMAKAEKIKVCDANLGACRLLS